MARMTFCMGQGGLPVVPQAGAGGAVACAGGTAWEAAGACDADGAPTTLTDAAGALGGGSGSAAAARAAAVRGSGMVVFGADGRGAVSGSAEAMRGGGVGS